MSAARSPTRGGALAVTAMVVALTMALGTGASLQSAAAKSRSHDGHAIRINVGAVVRFSGPSVSVSGSRVTIRAGVTRPRTTTYRHLQMAVRSSTGTDLDSALRPNTRVAGGVTRTLTSTRTYAPGSYTTFLAYTLDGTSWVQSSRRTFIVAKKPRRGPAPTTTSTATPAPTSTATPAPTSTATPAPTSTATPAPTLTATATPAPTNASGLLWKSGYYTPSGSRTRVAQFGAWRQRPVDVVVDWPARATWNDIVNPSWLYDRWAGTSYTKVFGVAMVPEGDPSATIAGCAAGSYNDKWRQFGTNIAARGLAHQTIIRLGWEFNGNWYKWSAYDPALWAQCWRSIVTSAEATAPALRWDWTVNRGAGQSVSNPTLAYPGDAYVDVVGVDSYDGWPAALDEAGWQQQYSTVYGLKYWSDFARAHGKKLSVPEWGVYPGTAWAGHNGGDNAFYIDKMMDFFAAQGANLEYESYFNTSASYYAGSIFDPVQVPYAASAYLRRWRQ